MQKNSDNFSIEEVKRLAESDVGKQLMALLRGSHPEALQAAQSGDLERTKKALASLLSDPKAQAIISQMQEDSHG